MTSRERIRKALSHEEADRIPIFDTLWGATIKRWREEGLPADISPAEYFGYEIVRFAADTTPSLPVEVLEETEEYIVHTTPFGGKRKNHKDYSTTPQVIDYPCKTRGDWEKIKKRLAPSPSRIDWDGTWIKDTPLDERGEDSVLEAYRMEWRRGLKGCRKARADGAFVVYSDVIGYDRLQDYVATEQLLMAIATEPEWLRDMYEVNAELTIEMYKLMKAGGFEFDGAFLFCDLGYRNGLLFSPRQFDEQLRPTFRRLFRFFHDQGLPVILHSCGNVTELIPRFVEDGLDCLQPLEVKAGMDLLDLKRQYGRSLAFMGGIDVRAMADPDPKAIEKEVKAKISGAKKGGGYIYHSDHSVPNNVGFDRYRRVMELVGEYGTY